MQPVSKNYNPYPDARRVDFRVVFALVDIDAAATAVPTVSGADPVSQIGQLTDGADTMSGKFAALETDLWALDGTFDIMPDNTAAGQVGWWSDTLSDEAGRFTVPPTLEFHFPDDVQSIGFTLHFDEPAGQWADKIRVTTYRADGSILTAATVRNQEAVAVIDLMSYGYRRVKFEFLSTNYPLRRVRVSEAIFGIIQRFDKKSLTKAELEFALSPTAEALPASELVITIDNLARSYNMVNPAGVYRYLQEGQGLTTTIEIGGEAVDMGTLFFTTAQADDDGITATITAHDKLYWLDTSIYRGGESGTWSFSAAVAAVLADAGVALEVDLPEQIGARIVGKCVPKESSHREALRLLSQAARCTCYVRRDGVLAFTEFPWGTSVDVMDGDNLTSLGGISVAERINTVELTVRDEYAQADELIFTASAPRGQHEGPHVKTVSNPCAAQGQLVANWLLALYQRRLGYDLPGRGNPAVELCDTVTVYDAFGGHGDAVVQEIDLDFDGGLSAQTKALGGAFL